MAMSTSTDTTVRLDGEGGSFQIEIREGARPTYYLLIRGQRLCLGGRYLQNAVPALLTGLSLTEQEIAAGFDDDPVDGYRVRYVLGFLPARYALYIGVRGSRRLLYFQDGGDTGADEDGCITLSEAQAALWREQLTALIA
jgi:hypothetical protein